MLAGALLLAATASACRRMLADSVSALDVEAPPRLLEQREMHFSAGDWGANGVLLLEADGSPCASGTNGDAGHGDFSASWDAPEQGCYRVDAHSAGAECGFGSKVTLTIDWCAGRTDTVQYVQTAGWTPLGVYPFYPGQLSGITQEEGAVDAFRVVALPDCRPKARPVFGSLTLDTDAAEMPANLASQLAQKFEGLGAVLSASFRPYVEATRRLSTLNHVVVDFDVSKLGAAPTQEQIAKAAEEVCGLLDGHSECGSEISFKLDDSSDVTQIKRKGPRGRKDGDRTLSLLAVLPVAGFFLVCVLAVLAKRFVKLQSAPEKTENAAEAAEEGKPAGEGEEVKWDNADVFWDAEDKKPQQEDDNVSTATPVSLPDSLPSEGVAERV